jgi:hypothetical protein
MADIRTSQPLRDSMHTGTPKTLDPTEARQGETTGRIRYVLAISLALCVVAFAIFYFVYMA